VGFGERPPLPKIMPTWRRFGGGGKKKKGSTAREKAIGAQKAKPVYLLEGAKVRRAHIGANDQKGKNK